MLLITGGVGFIGGNFVRYWLRQTDEPLIILDKLTYAAHLNLLKTFLSHKQIVFIQGDINDCVLLTDIFAKYAPRAVIHFAAESHVDKSIDRPDVCIQTNILGTFHLLEASRQYWNFLSLSEKDQFRFLHISTDEVFGSLGPNSPAFTETSPYAPNSPYSASKAASDHLVRSYYQTYYLPTIISNCSNNYGPYQFPEKLIPLTILNALSGKSLPIYGDGQQIRDWLFVEDHCNAIAMILEKGCPGESYNTGGNYECSNLQTVTMICHYLDKLYPKRGRSYQQQIQFVVDRPGHDKRYALNTTKIRNALNWYPKEMFETGLEKTIQWYLNHRDEYAQYNNEVAWSDESA